MNLGSDYVKRFTDSSIKFDKRSDEAIEEAIKNLNNFSLVGVLEDMDIFTKDYQHLFGAKLNIQHQRHNPLSKQKQQEMVTDEIKQKIERICQPNMKVYQSLKKSKILKM